MVRHESSRILVTGAGGGIGTAICRVLASRGGSVIAVDNDDRQLAMLAEAMKSLPGEHHFAKVDFLEKGMSRKLVSLLKSSGPAVNGLVNCAGVVRDAPLPMVSQADLNYSMQVNFFAAAEVMQLVARQMMRSGGAIVNVTSVTAMDPNVGQMAYGSSKAALEHLTKAASQELGRFSIRVNSVAPGLINTALLQSVGEPRKSELLSKVALSRIGDPVEVANVVSWLLSDEASYVTGQSIRIDGCM